MQNIGFAHALFPGLQSIRYGDRDEALEPYLQHFNTHPYLAPTLIGAALNLEEQGQAEQFHRIKQSMSSTLAALGDTLFWATIKPLLALLLVLTVLCDQIWGVVLLFVLTNCLHLGIMSYGFILGYEQGPAGMITLARRLPPERSRRLSVFIPLLGGIILAVAANWHNATPGLLPTLGLFALCVGGRVCKFNVYQLFYGLIAFTVIWTIA